VIENSPTKKMINVRLSPELWQRAKAAAGARGMTLERWVTDALEAHLVQEPRAKAVDEGDLAWRVAALEQAVDYLASAIGAGFPDQSPAPNGPASGALS
jgi:hypothetical protein